MPAYNEGEVIASVVEKWTDLLKKGFQASDNPLLIVVNDGSKDNTGEILRQLAATNPLLMAVDQPNGGHGNAVVHAYKKALEIIDELNNEKIDLGLMNDRYFVLMVGLGFDAKVMNDVDSNFKKIRHFILVNDAQYNLGEFITFINRAE